MTTVIATGAVCLVLGILGGWLWAQRGRASAESLQAQLFALTDELNYISSETGQTDELNRTRGEMKQLRQQLEDSRIAQTRLEEQAKTDKEKLSWLEEAKKHIQDMSGKVLSEQREVMTQKGRQTFSDTLKPFSEQIKEFRTRMDNLNVSAAKERTELQTMVKSLSEQTGQVSEEAHELTRALKGDSQMRGEWGEVSLQRVLQTSGLQEGLEYQTQQSFSQQTDEGDRRLRPDVVVHLPDERDIVIDAKLSLNSWVAASNAEDSRERDRLGQEFIAAVRAQIKNLSGKEYQHIEAIRTLEFIFMYIPVEPAYMHLLQQAPELVSEAFNKRVSLVSSTTLLPVLRIVENLWRLDRQNRNSQKIAEEAGRMYDKLLGFVDSMTRVDKGLTDARGRFDQAMNRLTTGKGNLIGRAERVRKLGAPVKAKLPDDFVQTEDSAAELSGNEPIEPTADAPELPSQTDEPDKPR